MHILAADDDVTMTDLYRDLFEDAGHTLATAPDADAAMEEYYNRKPDVMILDVEMPGGGGEHVFTLARKILGEGVPVIFVTGIPEKVSHFALTDQNVRVFAKPVETAELLKTVEELGKAK